MAQPYIGFIYMAAFNFAPKNFALCNGQTLAINQNQALFALIGTTYGGNGVSTFQLPNLQSRLPVHQGQGSGLSFYNLGQTGGVPSVTLNQSTVPPHTHTFTASTTDASASAVANTLVLGQPTATNANLYATSGAPPLTLDSVAVGAVSSQGGGQAHTNLMPSLGVSFFIALAGVFPSRN